MYDNSTTAVQQYGREHAELVVRRRRGRVKRTKIKILKKIRTGVHRMLPERGRYGGFCLSTSLQPPRSPSTCTAVDVEQYVRIIQEYMRWYRVCSCVVQGMDVQQHMRWCSGTVLGVPFFNYYPPSRGASDPSPGEALDAPRSPSRSSAPVLSPVRHRAAVRNVRGATARPREAKWSSRLAAVLWVCYIQNIFKEPNDCNSTMSQA